MKMSTWPPSREPRSASSVSRTHLPKRDELELREVHAFPKASMSGLACRIEVVRRAPLALVPSLESGEDEDEDAPVAPTLVANRMRHTR